MPDEPDIQTPDEPSMADIADAVAQAADAAGAEGAPEVTPAPEPEPEATTYSQEQYDELQGQIDAYGTMAGLLKEAGVTDVDSLKARLAAPTTDTIKELFQEALGQKPPAEPATPTPASPTPMSPDEVRELVRQGIEMADKARADRAYQDAVSSEAALKAKIVGDPRFAAVMQKGGFDQAWKGEKGRAAKTLAILADHLLYERGLKSPDGAYHPVTDPAAVGEVAEELANFLNELKAVTLHQVSADVTGIEAPDAPLAAVGRAPEGVEPSAADVFDTLWMDEEQVLDEEAAKRMEAAKRAIARDFEQSYRKAAANQGRLPTSQLEP